MASNQRGTAMIDREAELARLGVAWAQELLQADASIDSRGIVSACPEIPALSAYGAFTPITVRASTSRPLDANMERDKQ